MKTAKSVVLAALALTIGASMAMATPYREEHVTGGVLDLLWAQGYDTPASMTALVLTPDSASYANPSGDHTVAVAQNVDVNLGGLIVTTIDAQGVNDYQWEAWMNTGYGNTRRGLIFRATPTENVKTFYMFVLESGLLRLRFRKLVAPSQISTIVGEWFTTALPGGLPALQSWHHMKVVATGNYFSFYWDGVDLTNGTPIADVDPLLTGNVGVYNFSFQSGFQDALFDDLLLSDLSPTAAKPATWGAIKKLYK